MSEMTLAARSGRPFAHLDSRAGGLDAAMSRALDIALSFSTLAFFFPLLVVIAALVFVTNPGPIFFAHRRMGRNGIAFPCLKFRTMVVDAEARLNAILSDDPIARLEWERDHKLKNDPRITAIGNFMRKSSLDELPQLLNVLRGDMAIVGPRPIVLAEANRYGRYFQDYCRVRPGITGMWQISGRNDVTYRRRVALDVAYARTRSIGLDLKIILLTIPAVFTARGSY